jgi:hypothetical protein
MTDLVGLYFIAFDDCEETAWDGIVRAKLDQGFYLIQDLDPKTHEQTGPSFVVPLAFMHENGWRFFQTIEDLKTALDTAKPRDRVVHLFKSDKPN